MHNRRTATLQIQREAAQSGVDNLYARKKRAMRLWNIVILVMRQANGEQYRLFEGFYHGNPGFTEFSSCSLRPCGSPSVPVRVAITTSGAVRLART